MALCNISCPSSKTEFLGGYKVNDFFTLFPDTNVSVRDAPIWTHIEENSLANPYRWEIEATFPFEIKGSQYSSEWNGTNIVDWANYPNDILQWNLPAPQEDAIYAVGGYVDNWWNAGSAGDNRLDTFSLVVENLQQDGSWWNWRPRKYSNSLTPRCPQWDEPQLGIGEAFKNHRAAYESHWWMPWGDVADLSNYAAEMPSGAYMDITHDLQRDAFPLMLLDSNTVTTALSRPNVFRANSYGAISGSIRATNKTNHAPLDSSGWETISGEVRLYKQVPRYYLFGINLASGKDVTGLRFERGDVNGDAYFRKDFDLFIERGICNPYDSASDNPSTRYYTAEELYFPWGGIMWGDGAVIQASHQMDYVGCSRVSVVFSDLSQAMVLQSPVNQYSIGGNYLERNEVSYIPETVMNMSFIG